MCGRYSLGQNPDVQNQVQVDYPAVNPARWVNRENHRPRFNVAPRSNAPVVRQEGDGARNVVLQTMKWGVIPHWTKHQPDSSAPLNTINARSENLLETTGGMWGSLKGKKRCLVVCDGYYEWLKKGAQKVPHYTKHPDGKCMLLAGLWDSVTFEDASEPLFTYTIITTDSNPELSFLHDRMPVVLSDDAELAEWLDPSNEWSNEKLGKLLRPYEHHLECYPVAQEVGSIRNNSPTFIEPISKRSDGIEAMFKKQAAKKPSPTKPQSESAAEHSQSQKTEGAPATPERSSSPEVLAWISQDNQPSEATASTKAKAETEMAPAEDEDDVKVQSPPPKSTTTKKADNKGSKRRLEDDEEATEKPPSSKKPKSSTSKASGSQSQSSPSKIKGKKQDSANTKITSFFTKS